MPLPCHQQDSQPTKHTHLLSEIQAQSVEDQGMYLYLHIVSCFLLIVSLSFCKKYFFLQGTVWSETRGASSLADLCVCDFIF